MCSQFRPARVMPRRHGDNADHVHVCGPWKLELVAPPFNGMLAVAQLEQPWRLIGEFDAQHVNERRLGRPTFAATRAIALAPLHIGTRDALNLPAMMAVLPIVWIATRIAPDPKPALSAGLLRFPLLQTDLAAHIGAAQDHPFDQLPLAADGVAAGCAENAVMPIRIVAMEKCQASLRGARHPICFGAAAAAGLCRAERENLVRGQRAAIAAFQCQMHPVADSAVDAKAFVASHGLPSLGHGALEIHPDAVGHMARTMRHI